MTPADEILKRWARAGRNVSPGVSDNERFQFEVKRCVTLPSDLRDFLTRVGGNALGKDEVGNCGGDDLFSFWSLHEFRRVCHEIPWVDKVAKDVRHYFVFADWSISSCVYAICLAEEGKGTVVALGTRAKVVARSFSEFVGRYLGRPEAVIE